MKPIEIKDLIAPADYERLRSRLRPLFIHEKDRHRLAVGSHLTLLFENAQTVWYQVQEMIRAERITAPDAIRQELETYNELLPAPGHLKATLLIEYADPAERDGALKRLLGLERHLWFIAGQRRIAAAFDARQMSANELSAVQFVTFDLAGIDGAALRRLADAGALLIEVDHPSLAARAPINALLAAALAEDLGRG